MNFGSLFSGIGGFDKGFENAGMQCRWQCEIDSRCNHILSRHWPTVQKVNDVRKISAGETEPVDLICGGFPCQDVSVAGLRAGLAGERSGLWFEFHRILEELRPRWVVIENVPGLLSSNAGRDFATILRGLVELRYGVSWRVLDAEYFGLAQRRHRLFIVGSLGNGCSAQVLFEREGGAWNSAPRREKRPELATDIAASLRVNTDAGVKFDNEHGLAAFSVGSIADYKEGIGPLRANGGDIGGGSETLVTSNDVAGTLTAIYAKQSGNALKPDVLVAANNFGERDIATALSTKNQRIDPDTETFIVSSSEKHGGGAEMPNEEDADQIPYNILSLKGNAMERHAYPTETAKTLDSLSGTADKNGGGTVVVRVHNLHDKDKGDVWMSDLPGALQATGSTPNQFDAVVSFSVGNSGDSFGIGDDEDVTPPIRGGGGGNAVPGITVPDKVYQGDRIFDESETWPTLPAQGANNGGGAGALLNQRQYGVRRLTPTECERIQGFEDGWTNGQSDTIRYRQLGNAVAVPVAEWIARRIMEVDKSLSV